MEKSTGSGAEGKTQGGNGKLAPSPEEGNGRPSKPTTYIEIKFFIAAFC